MKLVEIKKSLIQGAGDGVFALKNFKIRDPIASYGVSKIMPTSVIMTPDEREYALTIEGVNHIGETDRSKLKGNDVAQFINDASQIKNQTNILEIGEYMMSYSKCNVIANGKVFYATKDIAIGEELYYHYGYKYWINGDCKFIDDLLLKFQEDLTKDIQAGIAPESLIPIYKQINFVVCSVGAFLALNSPIFQKKVMF
jgi:hypothetical protein